ncbi:glycoside hydrolase family 2 TIM barrel-domain containing protein [Robertkochia solimangrovi]|uniref:glycoside hydrolase family 2 TIM barrel-domain containing protein n=1 Tax=Robertkochia solimangrovi TaxID=2213046 RepID=UPI00117DB665|nr:glycoside hydrolase family 2 TIM barrel-domain containing protein [Robertkochia solimangrovi]TRZ45055.1 beta-galactosidase [Robertkochia solimangrovi]
MKLYFRILPLLLIIIVASSTIVKAQETQIIYLSGKDFKQPVSWNFMVTDGNNSGEWTTIDVPSQWELQGFGTYTYGRWYKELNQEEPSKEEGFYKYEFEVPEVYSRQQVSIVFGGAMTDTEVKINGRSAGPVHQGGFYQFEYEVGDLLKYGQKNLLEVHVKKHSDNADVNNAERKADWWLFGGIYRPVWLAIKPKYNLGKILVDAGMDGNMKVRLMESNLPSKAVVYASIKKIEPGSRPSENKRIELAKGQNEFTLSWDDIALWNPEDPNRYVLELQLKKNDEVLHEQGVKFGFRTVEAIRKDGIYVNGKKIIMKGINRHTIWPESGRSTNREISDLDVNLMKDMNMNAVRMHYPPDSHFLEACDSLGLFVLDELAGWQNPYDVETGKKLIREMVLRDANHPSVIIWDQGNEGGWRDELDAVFAQYDIQNRIVIHPWADHDGWDTHHYPTYLTGVHRFVGGENVFFPTEFMHGTYDNGHGSGLEDFWNRFKESPLFAGGFMWAFSDEAVLRTDWTGPRKFDSKGSLAPDGILGPHREKEGSFYAVKDIWSPIQIDPIRITPKYDGALFIKNDYIYSDISTCNLEYKVVKLPENALYSQVDVSVLKVGNIDLPSIAPGETKKVTLELPQNFFEGDWLEITAFDHSGRLINTWTWPIHSPEVFTEKLLLKDKASGAEVAETLNQVVLKGGAIVLSLDKTTGMITAIKRNGDLVPFNEGPKPVGMKAAVKSVETGKKGEAVYCLVHYSGGIDTILWTMYPDGRLKMELTALKNAGRNSGFDGAFFEGEIDKFGITFSYPEDGVTGMKWFGKGPYRVWKNRLRGTDYGLWYKDYNNTITGESFENLIYPEFKGYHADLIGASIEAGTHSFKVFSESEKVFLRLLTPDEPKYALKGADAYPDFPEGDISFMYEIPAMKSFKPVSQHGPHSQPSNIRIKSGDDGITMKLWFDFR